MSTWCFRMAGQHYRPRAPRKSTVKTLPLSMQSRVIHRNMSHRSPTRNLSGFCISGPGDPGFETMSGPYGRRS